MKKSKPGAVLRTMQQRPHRGRGAVYRWLRLHYREVSDGFAQTNAPWDTVVESILRDGITGQRGTKPNINSVSKVWNRVCADVKAEAIEQRTGVPQRKRQPSHLPANWQPTPAAVQAVPPAAQPAAVPSPSAPGPGEVRKRTPEEKLAAIRAEFDARSGR